MFIDCIGSQRYDSSPEAKRDFNKNELVKEAFDMNFLDEQFDISGGKGKKHHPTVGFYAAGFCGADCLIGRPCHSRGNR